MKARGTRGGILLSIEGNDTVESVAAALETHQELLAGKVAIEVADRISYEVIELIRNRVAEAEGVLTDIRPPTAVMQARGETVIVAKTVRSGGRIESTGSVVILGDVNAGAEIIANDDIVVVGALRGLAHAGAAGNDKAVIWAQQILSPQLRIGNAVAQAGVTTGGEKKAEVAHLRDGQILLRPWS